MSPARRPGDFSVRSPPCLESQGFQKSFCSPNLKDLHKCMTTSYAKPYGDFFVPFPVSTLKSYVISIFQISQYPQLHAPSCGLIFYKLAKSKSSSISCRPHMTFAVDGVKNQLSISYFLPFFHLLLCSCRVGIVSYICVSCSPEENELYKVCQLYWFQWQCY